MYTTILRRVLSTYTIILRRVNRMKIFVFVYIRRLEGLVAQGIRGSHRSCFGTPNRYGTEGRIWREIVKGGRNFSNLPAGITPFVSKLLKLPWRGTRRISECYCFYHFKKIPPKKCFWQEIEKICRILQR